jgi:hypothetical protein
MVQAKESIKISYVEPSLSAFAVLNLAGCLSKDMNASVVKSQAKVEVKDFLNVKMSMEGQTYHGELTICDILSRKHNSVGEEQILRHG